MPCRLSLVVFPALFSIAAGAAEELKDMAGSTIVVAGRLEAVECPGAGLYDYTGWPANLYRFEEWSGPYGTSRSWIMEQNKQRYPWAWGSLIEEYVHSHLGTLAID